MLNNTTATTFLGSIFAITLLTTPVSTFAAEYNGPQISFEQIYESPDDLDLNLNYAHQQAAAGDYLSAASTLERMLYASPNWDSARLFYALVLFKLDDRMGAKRELDLLDNRPLTSAQRVLVQAYRDNNTDGGSESSSTGFKGRIAVGVRYDDNAGNALADTALLAIANEDDMSVFAQIGIGYSASVGEDNAKFNAGINAQTRRHETFSNADYDSYGARAGFSGDSSYGFSWSADVLASQVNISGEKYLSQIGGRVAIKKSLSEKTGLWLRGTWHDQNYKNLSFTVTEPTRDGNKTSITAGVIQRFDSDSYIGASLGYEDKSAINSAFAYDGLRINSRFFKGFDNGVYWKGRATYRMIKYDGTSLINLIATRRDDDHFSAHVGLGASLNAIGSMIGNDTNPSMDNLGLEVGVNYTNRNSNNPLLKYENIGAELKLTWNF